MPAGLDRSGVVVCKVDKTRVDKTRHDAGVLMAGDTLLAVDGVSIADDGTIQFRVMERLAFAHLISQKMDGVSIADDGTIQLRVMGRLAFAHLISQKMDNPKAGGTRDITILSSLPLTVGDTCEITILRDRVVSTRTVVLKSPKYLVPECVYDVQP
ncbi:hypothetical protein T484DRAFT_1867947, partial [Baffinella frigidus]